MTFKQIYILLFIFLGNGLSLKADRLPITSLRGWVRDAETHEALSFATLQMVPVDAPGFYSAITTLNGEFNIKRVPLQKYKLTVSFVGYDKWVSTIELTSIRDNTITVQLKCSVTALSEVTVTASESKGFASASKIDQTAMRHLQPTSFSDLLELLPNGHSIDPTMGQVNLIGIREAGSVRQTIPSLGVKFMIDNTPLDNSANLQAVSGLTLGGDKESVAVGVDMRMLSTDDIKSVEIIRGIPSVEYGDLTSGLVKIIRKRRATPYRARVKADLLSKLFSVGKGFNITANDILNIDLGALDSKVDPRNNRENYKRLNASVRWNATRAKQYGLLTFSNSLDYIGSFDEVKQNKDISLKEDRYRSSYDKLFWRSTTTVKFNDNYWLSSLNSALSLSYEWNKITERKTISIDRPKGIPNIESVGAADGYYLPYHYVANLMVEGKPLYFNWHLKAERHFKWLSMHHKLKGGASLNITKNFGRGECFDYARPLNISSVTRPRPFSDIPTINRFSFYLENQLDRSVGEHYLKFLMGVRANSLLGLANSYAMHNKLYLDPRFNLQWQFPAFGRNSDWQLALNIGLGWLSQMPTTLALYPADRYYDIMQLNYYHTNPAYRRINIMTHKWNDRNYDIEPARNRKYEVRADLTHGEHKFSITLFKEYMNNAFSRLTYYKLLPYTCYDASNIDSQELTAPPALNQLIATQDTLINVFSKQGNGTRVRKRGVEFQYASPRFKSLHTKFTVMGAWYETTYSNREGTYKESSILLDGQQLQYIGYYDWEDGTKKQRFNTNIIADTFLPKIGMNFSLTAQCVWFTSSKPLWNSGVPISYIDKQGHVHDYTSESVQQLELKHLLKTYTDDYFDRTTVPLAIDLNLKATKHIAKCLEVSLFVNRLLTYYPDYHRNGMLIRRSSSPYFGMETNLTF